MYILGISAFFHDSAAVLIKDNLVVAACEEERFSRIKHDSKFPLKAIQACLEIGKITIAEVDTVAYYEKPLLRFERVIDGITASYPFSLNQFLKGIPEWLGEKIKVERFIKKDLNFKGNIYYIPHHLSHAASSFLSSGFRSAAILTIDGIGEYQTTGLWLGQGKKIKPLKKILFPHSVGLLYSTFTAFLGYKVNEDEYKLMGLSAYGQPSMKNLIYKIIQARPDGSFHLNIEYFSFHRDFRMWSKKFVQLFGIPRKPADPILKRHRDIAASIQAVTEELIFKMLQHAYDITKQSRLCIGGGVGLNALANGKAFKQTPFKKIYVIGTSGDNGAALGAAQYVSLSIKGNKRKSLNNLCLGTNYSDDSIQGILTDNNLKFKYYESEASLIKDSAKLLSKGKVLGWFQGKMEFGPRALGARSILARPFPNSMKERINIIKRREQFRPFAGSVLLEKVAAFFDVPKTQHDFPFMNFCFHVKDKMRPLIAAITHQDGTCRIQTVSRSDGRYYLLIKEFEKLTGIPVILNTSFNLRGEPIVESPQQAIKDFLKTGMDYLVIGDFLVRRI